MAVAVFYHWFNWKNSI